jgi:hypothetical protein
MQSVAKRLAIGANGYFFQQTTDDLQNGVRVGDGIAVAILQLVLKFAALWAALP